MLTLLIINALVITSNFNGYINFDFLSEQKEQIVTRTEMPRISVVQYTFDDDLNSQIAPIYDKLQSLNKDVIVIFNVNELHKSQLKTLSEGRFSYGLRQKEGLPSNIAVITKFAISSKRKNTFLDERGDILELILVIKNESVKLTVMHPPKPNSELNWQRRNLMLNTLEAMESRTENVLPYSLVISELYSTIWSRHFPKLDTLRTCSSAQGAYGSSFMNSNLKLLGNLGALNTSHCFFSYRFKLSDLESTQVANSLNNFVSYELTMQKAN
ncbi:hypothetical protein AAEU29_17885 [Pseudoalteromonas sp. SSM20]|uniref:hypothetical protein n=1 Tax=Pseudoalteromonas sp. SSM20 TaxID=3139394 RepID=UPI003BAD7C8D